MKWFHKKRNKNHTIGSFLATAFLLSIFVFGTTVYVRSEMASKQGWHDGYACGFQTGCDDRMNGREHSYPSHRIYFPDDFFLNASGLFTVCFDYYHNFAFVISEGYNDGYYGRKYQEKYVYPYRITIN